MHGATRPRRLITRAGVSRAASAFWGAGWNLSGFKYVVVGGGVTADAAVRAIRRSDPGGSVALVGAEAHPPYNRPPLSKGLWFDKPIEKIWRNTQELDVELNLGRRVVRLELDARRVIDDRGTVYEFERLLLATGGTPRRLPFGGDHVIYLRTLDDYLRLRALANERRRFVVIGGGFIGSEIAAALATAGRRVTMIFPEGTVGARVFPTDLGHSLNDYYREKGVELLPEHAVEGVDRRGNEIVVTARSRGGSPSREIAVDGVVAGLGITPNTELAEAAGLDVGNGIVVDEHLRTSHARVWAAGDVANFPSRALATRMRVEHEDNALTMGATAGRNMAGEDVPYHHQPYFYSDLFDLGYEAVGELDARLETVSDWEEPFRKGVVYYLRDGRVRGVLLLNVWGQVDAGRALIAETAGVRPAELAGRIRG